MHIGDKDQIKAGFIDIAEMLALYRKSLIDQGFTKLESLQLVIAYQSEMLFGSKK